MGEGPRGSNGAFSTLHRISVTPSGTHNQMGPLWCWFPSRWACACSRTLWVSPTTSPGRLGVSPAATSTPTGVFNQRFEALFPCAGALGCGVCFAPLPFLLVYLCTNVGPWGLLAFSLPSLFVPQSASLWVRPRQCESSLSQLPICASPTDLDERFFFISLVVGLPCGSIFCHFWLFLFLNCCPCFGCARRHSVSTYVSILVLLNHVFKKFLYFEKHNYFSHKVTYIIYVVYNIFVIFAALMTFLKFCFNL